MQECIWPRAIVCILPARLRGKHAVFNFSSYHMRESCLQEFGSDFQYYIDITHSQITSGSPILVARQLQKKFGRVVRVGLSVNAPLAYYSAHQCRNSKINTIAPWEVNPRLAELDLRNLLFIEKDLLQRMELFGIKKVKQLTEKSRQDIIRLFGMRGAQLLALLNGHDYFSCQASPNNAAKHITEYLVLPPNSTGKKLIMRYLGQTARRLMNTAQLQNRLGSSVQATLFLQHSRKVQLTVETGESVSGKSVFKNIVEKLPGKELTGVVLAIELKMMHARHISGQKELPLECLA